MVKSGFETPKEEERPKEVWKPSIGDSVRVQRKKDGPIENDWVVGWIDDRHNMITVVKDVQDGSIQKDIALEKLERLNRPAVVADIQAAENLAQLLDTLLRLPGIQSESGNYVSEHLVHMVVEVMAGRQDIKYVTRAGGLRQKVTDLLSRKGSAERET